jgi:hypothetical protein
VSIDTPAVERDSVHWCDGLHLWFGGADVFEVKRPEDVAECCTLSAKTLRCMEGSCGENENGAGEAPFNKSAEAARSVAYL